MLWKVSTTCRLSPSFCDLASNGTFSPRRYDVLAVWTSTQDRWPTSTSASLADVVTERFLDVHIFTRLASPDGHERVPVVRRCDGDGVQLLILQRFADVLDTGRRPSPFFFDRSTARREQPGIGINQVGDLHP